MDNYFLKILVLLMIIFIGNTKARIEYNRTSDFVNVRPERIAELGDAYKITNRTLQVQRNSTVTVDCKAPEEAYDDLVFKNFYWKVHTIKGFKVNY